MPSIARGQENTTDRINWFVTINGVLADVYEIGFRILDISGGLPGTQIFPTTPGDFEDVTSAPGRFNVGSYYAYDNTGGTGWTPELTASLGDHRIEWRWKTFASSNYQLDAEDFTVLVESAGSSADTYITVQDIRDVGITVTMADDQTVLDTIAIWQEFIDRACRQWFNPRALTLQFDGTDSDTLHFGIPIISIDYVRLNNDPNNLNTDYYRVYSSRSYPDDRRNPRIKLVRSDEFRDIYTAPLTWGELRFRKGRQNQTVKGTFGFTESDGSVPKLIQRALTKLVVEKLQNPIFHDYSTGPAPVPTPPPIVGPMTMEKTDDHERRFGQSGGAIADRRPGLAGITDDQEILGIIKLYRAPLGIATPAHWSYV